jgi:uncharacterized membrane protein
MKRKFLFMIVVGIVTVLMMFFAVACSDDAKDSMGGDNVMRSDDIMKPDPKGVDDTMYVALG